MSCYGFSVNARKLPHVQIKLSRWVQEEWSPGYKEHILLFDISACSMSDQTFHLWNLVETAQLFPAGGRW